MDGFVFLAVIVAASILESVLRKKKRLGDPNAGGHPTTTEGDGALPDLELEAVQLESRGLRSTVPEASGEPGLSKDLWEELAALAGGRLALEVPPAAPQSAPEPDAEAEAEVPPDPDPRGPREVVVREPRVPDPARSRAVATSASHRVHRSHAEYGTAPSSRSRSEQDGMDPLAAHVSEEVQIVRGMLRSGNGHSLRRAVILQELLGPPVALRD